jgi:hypothetical protein
MFSFRSFGVKGAALAALALRINWSFAGLVAQGPVHHRPALGSIR